MELAKQFTATHLLDNYTSLNNIYDEIFRANGEFHPDVAKVIELFNNLDQSKFRRLQNMADHTFHEGGITFTVYSDKRGQEKIFPFDLIPRIIPSKEWHTVEVGLKQRIQALNEFLYDIYHEQKIIKDGIVPEELINSSSCFYPQLKGITPPGKVYVHIAGIDLIRDHNGDFLVLEDNLRTPSGVSYVLENRFVMQRLFPEIFANTKIHSVNEYPLHLRHSLSCLARKDSEAITSVVLTPGAYNSAYFEHSFIARQMGCDLVKGQDLFVKDDKVFLKTTRGPVQVQVIYRRIDDDYLDPQMFRADSLLGVSGLMRAYAKGNVVIANAVGNGVADDKAIYPYVPQMIKYYLDAEPILKQVPTFDCNNAKHLNHVLENMQNMVVKAVDSAGGYGMLMGNQASKTQISQFKNKIKHNPRKYIAQPIIELSTCPTYTGKDIAPRRVDLRPFVITGQNQWVLPGGLTRVALTEGSYVVNSSQGGGSKDTWVLENDS